MMTLQKDPDEAPVDWRSLLRFAAIPPERLDKPSAWTGHIPFASWLVGVSKPRTLVELGVHFGTSYFNFCRAVKWHQTGTECIGVDLWQGDKHAGYYGEEVYSDVEQYNQAHFSDFSRLLRMTFQEAVDGFRDGQIDLLHIDGLHTYEAVKHDFETWLPKLSPTALVLFHDTNVFQDDFGVWRFWLELQERYPRHLEFKHSHGLGVLQIGTPVEPDPLRWLCSGAPEREPVAAFMTQRGQEVQRLYGCLQEQLMTSAQWEEDRNAKDGEVAEVRHALQSSEQALNTTRAALLEREQALGELRYTLSQWQDELATLQKAVVDRDSELRATREILSERESEAHAAQEILNERESELRSTREMLIERERERDAALDALHRCEQGADTTMDTLRARDEAIGQLRTMLRERDQDLANARNALREHQRESRTATDRLLKAHRELAALKREFDQAAQRALEREAILGSTSWRITRPLRVVVGLLRRDPAYVQGLMDRMAARPTGNDRRFDRLDASVDFGVQADEGANGSSRAAPIGVGVGVGADDPGSRTESLAHAAAGLPGGLADATRVGPPLGRREIPVDIIVCVHDALDDVRACLDAVLRGTLPPYRLIIVDDGSGEETRRWLESFADRNGARLIRHLEAKGYTLAANTGLRIATAPWVVLLNSDTIPGNGWLDRLVEAGERDPRIGLVGPLSNTASWQSVPLVQEGGDWASNPIPEGLTIDDVADVVARVSIREGTPLPFLNGFCLGIRRSLIEDIGIFDEELFGAGYGEENDYCIRARQRGWQLLVVDDAYVFHAQSRSYSNERRAELAQRAGEVLSAKYDPTLHIDPQVAECREKLTLVGARGRIAEALDWESRIAPRARQWEGRRIAFVLPVAFVGGGANVVIQEALALSELGIDCWIINFIEYRDAFENSYPGLTLPVLYADGEWGVPAVCNDLGVRFDAIIATYHSSVFSLPSADGHTRLGYYIQDFEPWFYPSSDPRHIAATRSYSARPEVRMFTKTDWNADRVEEVGTMRPAVIGPSVDTALFRPAPHVSLTREGPVRVCAMVRPGDGTGRRAPELTLRVLQRLIADFGEGIDVTVFGASSAAMGAAGLQSDGIRSVGELDPAKMATLLKQSDVFLDFSRWQAMGLTALEAMAAGCAVVVPQAGGAVSFARHEQNALLVDTGRFEACVTSASRLLRDRDLRSGLRVHATMDATRFHPRRAALAMAEVLFAAPAAREGFA